MVINQLSCLEEPTLYFTCLQVDHALRQSLLNSNSYHFLTLLIIVDSYRNASICQQPLSPGMALQIHRDHPWYRYSDWDSQVLGLQTRRWRRTQRMSEAEIVWGFPEMKWPQSGWLRMQNPMKMDDMGVPPWYRDCAPYLSHNGIEDRLCKYS